MDDAKDVRDELREARRLSDEGRARAVSAATRAKAEGVPVQEIADLLGFKTRRGVYLLIERGH
jgi:hypothetical protein